MNLVHLRCALRVDEVDALEIEHERVGRRPLGELANALLECLRGGKNRPPSMRRTTIPGNVSSAGFSSRSRKTWVPAWRPSSGIGGLVATSTGHRARERPRPRRRPGPPPRERRRSPRPQSRSRIASPDRDGAARDVDHAENDRVNDHGPEDGLGELREQRRENQQSRDHEAAGDERRDLRARAGGLVQRAGQRLVETGIPWNTPAPTLAIP